jgi:hypothetical protein
MMVLNYIDQLVAALEKLNKNLDSAEFSGERLKRLSES